MPYERVDFNKVEEEFTQLMKEFKEARNGEEQFAVHRKYYELRDRVDTLMTIAHIRHDVNTADEFYSAEQDYYDEESPRYSNMVINYEKLLYESPYRNVLEDKIGLVAFKNMELSQKSMQEKLIPLVQEENALTTAYEKIPASAEFDWDGEKVNISRLKAYLKNPDRNVRRKAWEKFSAFFKAHEGELDDIYDKLVKNRTKQAKELGYENYVELGYYRMNRNCYTREQVEAFRDQVKKDFVPFVEKLHDRRRQRLGLDKLSFIDEGVYFKEGNPNPVGTPEEILEAGQRMYGQLSPETKEFFDFMMENELFDVLGRNNKRVGGYMTYLPVYRSPFIFANFNGTSADVDVITHECGHAFQGYLSGMDEIREHGDITMETAECHSMSMEFFTEKWMDWFFGDKADAYREMHFEDAMMFIPYGCMVDEFQHLMYENEDLTPDERHGVWEKLEKKYRPWLSMDGLPFYGRYAHWQWKPHIYLNPLYYIDYCMAGTVAFQVWTLSLQDRKAAWEKYLAFVDQAGTKTFADLCQSVGLRIPYEDGCIREVGSGIRDWIRENRPAEA